MNLGEYFSDKFPDFKIKKADKDKLAEAAEKSRIAFWQEYEDERKRNKQPPGDWRGRVIRGII